MSRCDPMPRPQIYDVLSYYYEHQKEIDKEIDEDSEENIKNLVKK